MVDRVDEGAAVGPVDPEDCRSAVRTAGGFAAEASLAPALTDGIDCTERVAEETER